MTIAYEPSSVQGKDATGALMQAVLDSIVAKFEEEGVDLPDRRYLATGATAHDCEQLTVSFVQMYLGTPGDPAESPQRCDSPRSVVLSVQLVRCLPTTPPRASGPQPAAISGMTERQTQDAWLLMDGAFGPIQNLWLDVLADVTVTDPQGQYQAIVLNLTVAVP